MNYTVDTTEDSYEIKNKSVQVIKKAEVDNLVVQDSCGTDMGTQGTCPQQ